MVKISIHTDIEGNKFRKFMDFITERSDTISVARYYDGFLEYETFSEMQSTYKDYVYKEYEERRNKYINNINNYQSILKNTLSIKTDSEAFEHFEEMLKQDLLGLEGNLYDDFKNKADISFKSTSTEFIKNEFTRMTPVTRNPVFELCYFKIGLISKSIIDHMKGIYDFPYYIEGSEFEDIAYYNHDNLILAVCSHEGYARLYLTENEYEIFKHLEIEHEKY